MSNEPEEMIDYLSSLMSDWHQEAHLAIRDYMNGFQIRLPSTASDEDLEHMAKKMTKVRLEMLMLASSQQIEALETGVGANLRTVEAPEEATE